MSGAGATENGAELFNAVIGGDVITMQKTLAKLGARNQPHRLHRVLNDPHCRFPCRLLQRGGQDASLALAAETGNVAVR